MASVSYVDDLLSLTRRWLNTSLNEVKKYLHSKGNPHEALRIFHVTGTNGKWSVCQMLSQLLHKQFGKRVGLFLSPHLVRVNERIQINSKPITDTNFNKYVGKIYEETKGLYDFSFFVILFLASIYYFLDKKVDYVVCEVGLWGTRDATNVWNHPLATFITSVGYDHQRLLGKKLSQIQCNKMWIMKAGVPCYTPVHNDLMRRWATQKKASLRIIADGKVECWYKGVYKNTKKGLTNVPTNLPGSHQEQNAALVYHCLRELGYKAEDIKQGLQRIVHMGRCQWLAKNILLDGAHNTSGIEVLSEYVDTVRHRYTKVITLFGSCKTSEEVGEFLSRCIKGNENYLVQPSAHRWLAPAEYKEQMPFPVKVIRKKPYQAYLFLKDKLSQDTLLVVYGSLYLAGEILAEVGKKQ